MCLRLQVGFRRYILQRLSREDEKLLFDPFLFCHHVYLLKFTVMAAVIFFVLFMCQLRLNESSSPALADFGGLASLL